MANQDERTCQEKFEANWDCNLQRRRCVSRPTGRVEATTATWRLSLVERMHLKIIDRKILSHCDMHKTFFPLNVAMNDAICDDTSVASFCNFVAGCSGNVLWDT